MKTKFITAEQIPNLYSNPREGKGLQKSLTTANGRNYQLLGIADKNYGILRRFWLGVCSAVKMIFSCRSKEENKEKWAVFRTGKRVIAFYTNAPNVSKKIEETSQRILVQPALEHPPQTIPPQAKLPDEASPQNEPSTSSNENSSTSSENPSTSSHHESLIPSNEAIPPLVKEDVAVNESSVHLNQTDLPENPSENSAETTFSQTEDEEPISLPQPHNTGIKEEDLSQPVPSPFSLNTSDDILPNPLAKPLEEEPILTPLTDFTEPQKVEELDLRHAQFPFSKAMLEKSLQNPHLKTIHLPPFLDLGQPNKIEEWKPVEELGPELNVFEMLRYLLDQKPTCLSQSFFSFAMPLLVYLNGEESFVLFEQLHKNDPEMTKKWIISSIQYGETFPKARANILEVFKQMSDAQLAMYSHVLIENSKYSYICRHFLTHLSEERFKTVLSALSILTLVNLITEKFRQLDENEDTQTKINSAIEKFLDFSDINGEQLYQVFNSVAEQALVNQLKQEQSRARLSLLSKHIKALPEVEQLNKLAELLTSVDSKEISKENLDLIELIVADTDLPALTEELLKKRWINQLNTYQINLLVLQTLKVLQNQNLTREQASETLIDLLQQLDPYPHKTKTGKPIDEQEFYALSLVPYVKEKENISLLISCFGQANHRSQALAQAWMQKVLDLGDAYTIESSFEAYWLNVQHFNSLLPGSFVLLLPHIDTEEKLKIVVKTMPEDMLVAEEANYLKILREGQHYKDPSFRDIHAKVKLDLQTIEKVLKSNADASKVEETKLEEAKSDDSELELWEMLLSKSSIENQNAT